MNAKAICYFFGKTNILVIFFSLFNILYCFYFDYESYVYYYLPCLTISLLFFFLTKKINFDKSKFGIYELIIFALFGWFILPLLLSTPFYLGGYEDFLKSYYEAISGFTSFGATIFSENLSSFDTPILLWRSSTQVIGSIFYILTIILVLGNKEINIFPLKFITKKKESISFFINFDLIFNNIIYAFSIIFLITLFFLNFTDLRMLDKFHLTFTIISTGGFVNKEILFSDFDKIVISILLIFSSLNIFLILGLLKISNIYTFIEDRFFLFFLGIFLLLAILLNQNLELNDVWIQFISAVSNSGINFTNNNHYSHFTFILITLSFFGGCLLSSSSGFKLARVLILFNKVYYELLKLLSPSVVINSSIFKSKEKIKINDFYSSALLLVFFLILFLLYSAVLSFEELSFKNSFITSILLIFNTLPSSMYFEEGINFANFSNFTIAVSILMLIISKLTPLSILALIRYKFIN